MDRQDLLDLLVIETIAECAPDIIAEFYNNDDDENEFLEEGYNLDLKREIKSCKAKFKQANSTYKKCYKNKDKKGCLDACKEMRTAVNETKTIIKNMDKNYSTGSMVGSAILGNFFAMFGNFKAWITILLVTLTGIGAPVGIYMGLKKLIQQINTVLNDIRNYNGAKDVAKMVNRYRNFALTIVQDIEDKIKKLEANANKL